MQSQKALSTTEILQYIQNLIALRGNRPVSYGESIDMEPLESMVNDFINIRANQEKIMDIFDSHDLHVKYESMINNIDSSACVVMLKNIDKYFGEYIRKQWLWLIDDEEEYDYAICMQLYRKYCANMKLLRDSQNDLYAMINNLRTKND